MKDNRELFTEEVIIGAVKRLLTGRVNGLLNGLFFQFPPIEFCDYKGGEVIVPVISVSTCECSEKERIVKQEAYTLTIVFNVPETTDSEFNSYGYLHYVCKAVSEDPTLGGAVDKAVVTNKKYTPPKKTNCGLDWEAVVTLRITVEGIEK